MLTIVLSVRSLIVFLIQDNARKGQRKNTKPSLRRLPHCGYPASSTLLHQSLSLYLVPLLVPHEETPTPTSTTLFICRVSAFCSTLPFEEVLLWHEDGLWVIGGGAGGLTAPPSFPLGGGATARPFSRPSLQSSRNRGEGGRAGRKFVGRGRHEKSPSWGYFLPSRW